VLKADDVIKTATIEGTREGFLTNLLLEKKQKGEKKKVPDRRESSSPEEPLVRVRIVEKGKKNWERFLYDREHRRKSLGGRRPVASSST